MATQWLAEKRERYCGTSKVSTSGKTESGLTYETYTLPDDFDKNSDGAKWRKNGEKLIDLGKRKDGTRIFSYRCYFRCSEKGTQCPLRKTCQMLEGEIVETKYNGFFHVHTSPETGLRNVMIEVDGIVPVPSVSDDREPPKVAPVVHPGPAPVPTDRKEAGDADVRAGLRLRLLPRVRCRPLSLSWLTWPLLLLLLVLRETRGTRRPGGLRRCQGPSHLLEPTRRSRGSP